jgi:hypothetical protein
MGIIRDILDTVKDVSSGASSMGDVFKTRSHSSLSKRSLEGTLQFPVLVSKSLDLDTLQMTTKALERQYASFVQVVLSMSPTLDLSKDKDAAGFIRRFHQNSNVKLDFHDIGNMATDLMENYTAYGDDLEQKFLFAAVYEGSTARLVASNKEQLQSVLEGVRDDVLNSKFVPRNPLYRFKNDNLNMHHNRIVTEAPSRANNHTDYSTKVDNGSSLSQSFTGNIANVNMTGGGGSMKTPEKEKFDLPNNILKDNDAKKANELVPTTMHVRTILMNKEGKNQGTMDFIIGIKSTMHPIPSDEMVSNVLNAVQSKSRFFNTVRWTSGEISFFKDFLFNIKEIKDDVANRSSGSSPWWIALKRRRALAKIKGALMIPNQILPNASIVVSMEEVDFIKSNYGYDLMNSSFVDKIMKEYFLIGFVIVDNSTQIAHFLFDGQEGFQSVTFGGLEQANKSGGGSDLKDVLKLVQRI